MRGVDIARPRRAASPPRARPPPFPLRPFPPKLTRPPIDPSSRHPFPTPQRRARTAKPLVPESERRRSTRERVEVNYAERYGLDDDDSDAPRNRARRSTPPKPRAKLLALDGSVVRRRFSVGARVYDSELGVTCHWCRQKTVEAHVACTHPNCGGGRKAPVNFCGMCLRNRHGEDVREAASSGAWTCPKCRGSCGPGCDACCNCGPCRKAKGLTPTHQIIGLARAAGFDNVHDYLIHKKTGEGPEALRRRKAAQPWARAVAKALAAAAKMKGTPRKKAVAEEEKMSSLVVVDNSDASSDEDVGFVAAPPTPPETNARRVRRRVAA